MNKTGEDRMVSTQCPNRRQPLCQEFLRILEGVLVLQSCAAFADVATATVPANTDATLDEAFTAGYVSGVADYAGLLAATDLIVNGAGRLIIDKDLKTDGYAGEVHVSAGSRLQLRVTGALGDKAHGTFVADGATLETWTDGAQNTLSFIGEPLAFAGTGVDGEGALVSLTTANSQRNGAWGGSVLTMTGDAMVRLKGKKSNFDFPYMNATFDSDKLDMNGHSLTFCGPGGTSDYYTLPVRMNIVNPGHIIASNNVYISMNNRNSLGGSSANTFTLAVRSRLDFYQPTDIGRRKWTLIVKSEDVRNAVLSTSVGGIWDGPIQWEGTSSDSPILFTQKSENDKGNNVQFMGSFSTERGLEVANSTPDANRNLYPAPTLAFAGRGNRIGGVLKATDMEVSFTTDPKPSLGGIEIQNSTVSVNRQGIAGLWKGINQDYLSWNDTSAPSETRLRQDFVNHYNSNIATEEYVIYTNSVALGPDVVMNATKPNYSKATLVTYKGYFWNTGGNRVITFLSHVNGYVHIRMQRADGVWNSPVYMTDVTKASAPGGVRLASNGAYKIVIIVALHNGNGGTNAALAGDYGIMYCFGPQTSTSTDPADYMPLMDPGDGSLFTRYVPGTDEYEELGAYGTEPFELAKQLTGSAGSTLALGGGNYCVGAVTGAVTVVLDAAMPHAEHAPFTVADELHCRAADLVAGEHLTVTGALKFAEGSILSVSGTKSFPDYGTFVAAESTEAIVGVPALVSGAQSRLKMKVYASPSDGKKLLVDVAPKGTVVFFR